MTQCDLIHNKLTPVTVENYGDWYLEAFPNFEFTRHFHASPIAVIEFFLLSKHYPITFRLIEQKLTPIVILGVRKEHNLFITQDGAWHTDTYIPTLLRAYPFSMQVDENTDDLILLIDESSTNINQNNTGEAFFNELGSYNQYLLNAFQFLEGFVEDLKRTDDFTQTLQSLDILEPIQTQFKMPSGEAGSFNEDYTVSREALNALPSEQIGELAQMGMLEPIYLHLNSLSNLPQLIHKTRSTRQKP